MGANDKLAATLHPQLTKTASVLRRYAESPSTVAFGQ